jgi:hypothetical protein
MRAASRPVRDQAFRRDNGGASASQTPGIGTCKGAGRSERAQGAHADVRA